MHHAASHLRAPSRAAALACMAFAVCPALTLAAPPRDRGEEPTRAERPVAAAPGSSEGETPSFSGNAAPPFPETDPIAVALAPSGGGLTSEQVAERAVASAPQIQQRHAELEISHAQLNQTLLRFLPKLRVDAGYQRSNPITIDFSGGGASVGAGAEGPLTIGPCPFDPGTQCVLDSAGNPAGAVRSPPIRFPVNQLSLHGNLSVPVSDYVLSLVSARKGAVARREASELALQAERVKVRADARIAYYNWLKAIARVAIAERALENVRARKADADRAVAAGIAAKVDVSRFEAAIASGEATVIDAETFRDLAAENLALLMGDAPGTANYRIGEDVLADRPPDPSFDLPLGDLVAQAQAQRLELRAMSRQEQAVAHGIKAARAAYYPRLDGFVDMVYAKPNQRFFFNVDEFKLSWVIGLTLSWSINDTLLTKAQVREYKANRAATQAGLEQLRRGVVMEVEAAAAERKRAIAKIAATTRALEATTFAYSNIVRLYQGGRATATDVMDAETERIRAVLDAVDTRIDLRVAEVRLAHATGRLAAAEGPARP